MAWRRILGARALRLLTAGLVLSLAVLPSGCSGGSSGGGPTGGVKSTVVPVDYAESPAAAADRLAKALLAAKTADEVRPLAYDALARAGVAVRTPAGDYLAKTGPRAFTFWLFSNQADNLALDFLEHQGWTLTDFTQASAEFPGGPGKDLLRHPDALGRLLREWALIAEKSPDDPEAFAPLLLAGIARARGGGSDFTSEKMVPEQVELSYLELMLMSAGAFKAPASTSMRSPDRWARSLDALASAVSLAPESAYAKDSSPCAWIQETWGEAAQDFGEEGFGGMIDEAVDKVGDWLGGVGDGGLGGNLKTMASVMKWTSLLTSMISMYGGFSLTLESNPEKAHYLGYDGGHGNVKTEVIAKVSTRPRADDKTLDCLKWAGLETPKSDSAKDCTVEWVPLYGTPKHAEVASKDFKRQAVSSDGKAVLVLNMTPEKSTEAGKSGKIKKDQIVMQADLVTYKGKPSKILAATVFGGTSGGSIEVAKAWFNKWFPKRASIRIPVEYHELSKWKGTLPAGDGEWVFESGQGAKSIWTVKLVGAKGFSGGGSFDLKSGKAPLNLKWHLDTNAPISVKAKLDGNVALGGTDEEPTLIITGGAFDAKASGPGVKGGYKGSGKGQVTIKLVPVE